MLESLAEGLWHDQFDLFIPPGVHFRGRMVVARLSDGRLWVHSPIPIDDARAQQLAALGEVGHLVAPNALHHLHFGPAAARYPGAQGWIAPALVRKRPDLSHHRVLGDEPPADWAGDLDQCRVAGVPALDEVAFFHRASRSLVLCDLVFNILEYRGWILGLVFRMVGAHERLAQSRMLRLMTKDREAAAASVRKIMAWDFERVVMSHGEIVQEHARERLEGALQWMLGGARAIEAARVG